MLRSTVTYPGSTSKHWFVTTAPSLKTIHERSCNKLSQTWADLDVLCMSTVAGFRYVAANDEELVYLSHCEVSAEGQRIRGGVGSFHYNRGRLRYQLQRNGTFGVARLRGLLFGAPMGLVNGQVVGGVALINLDYDHVNGRNCKDAEHLSNGQFLPPNHNSRKH